MKTDAPRMDADEWRHWQETLPAIVDQIAPPRAAALRPFRIECLRVLEMHALSIPLDQAESFLALASHWKLSRLPDAEMELLVRVLLGLKGGRAGDLRLGAFGRLLLTSARRRAVLGQDYLEAFRCHVEAEPA